MKSSSIVFFLLLLATFSCSKSEKEYKKAAANPEFIHGSVKQLTDVIVHDIFSPPVASRVYAYPHIAAYEILLHDYPEYQSLAGQLNGFKGIPQPEKGLAYCFPLASVHAFLVVGRNLVFSTELLDQYEKVTYEKFRATGIPDEVYERSMQYGDSVAKSIMAYAGKDGYKETRGFRHTVAKEPGHWVPTPPAYMDAVEPNWFKLRPFVMDSCNQFAPPGPCAFSTEEKSDFYKEVREVYQTTTRLTEEQKDIARFWDCNPFVMNTSGHVMYATKKISPGGHWLGITGIVTRKKGENIMKTLEAYTRVTLALADAFISCWDEKYRRDRIRPETAINNTVDKTWIPLLQTPPFPEYPSGHSVISNAAAVVLTDLYGPTCQYTDSTEVTFGLPARSFTSFHQAADEAAISRLYGGIHFMSAIRNGAEEGRKVGEYVVRKLKTRKNTKSVESVAEVR